MCGADRFGLRGLRYLALRRAGVLAAPLPPGDRGCCSSRLAAGDAARVIEPLAQLVSVDPYYEEGHCLLIEASEAWGVARLPRQPISVTSESCGRSCSIRATARH